MAQKRCAPGDHAFEWPVKIGVNQMVTSCVFCGLVWTGELNPGLTSEQFLKDLEEAG